MILDKETLFSDAQSLAQTAATYLSTNAVDLLNGNTYPATAPRISFPSTDTLGNTLVSDIARARMVEVFIQITQTVTSGGAATITFNLIQSANANLSSATVLDTTGALALATMVAGYRPRITLVPGQVTQQYLGIQFVVATATTTAGAFTAGLMMGHAATAPGSFV